MTSKETRGPLLRRLRFSLKSLLVTVAFVSLALSLFVTAWRLRECETELDFLRRETGHFTLGDPGLLHAIAIPSYENLTFRWRIHVPANRSFAIRTVLDDIKQDGIPSDRDDTATLRSIQPSDVDRELVLSLAVRRDHAGRWGYGVEVSDQPVIHYYPFENAPWLDDVNNIGSSQAGVGRTVSETAGQGLSLLRISRLTQTAPGTFEYKTPAQGIQLWIAEESRPGRS